MIIYAPKNTKIINYYDHWQNELLYFIFTKEEVKEAVSAFMKSLGDEDGDYCPEFDFYGEGNGFCAKTNSGILEIWINKKEVFSGIYLWNPPELFDELVEIFESLFDEKEEK